MSEKGLSKELQSLRRLWLATAVAALVICLEVWTATQGGDGIISIGVDAVFGIDFAEHIPESIAALLGVAFLSVLTIVSGLVLLAHARKAPGRWGSRFPFRFFDLPPHYGIGSGVQVVAIIVLSLLPIYMLGHSFRVMLQHGVLCEEANDAWRLAPNADDLWSLRDDKSYKFSSSEEPVSCKVMVDYRTPLQTWAFAAMTSAGIIVGLISLVTIWLPKSDLGKGSRR